MNYGIMTEQLDCVRDYFSLVCILDPETSELVTEFEPSVGNNNEVTTNKTEQTEEGKLTLKQNLFI